MTNSFWSGIGGPINQLLGMQQANFALQNAMMAQSPEYVAMLQKYEREQFYRSVSQNWLNAMIDVELGI